MAAGQSYAAEKTNANQVYKPTSLNDFHHKVAQSATWFQLELNKNKEILCQGRPILLEDGQILTINTVTKIR